MFPAGDGDWLIDAGEVAHATDSSAAAIDASWTARGRADVRRGGDTNAMTDSSAGTKWTLRGCDEIR
jgi:hypothetical protein